MRNWLIAVGLLFVAGCAASSHVFPAAERGDAVFNAPLAIALPGAERPGVVNKLSLPAADAPPSPATAQARVVIYSGAIRLVVPDINSTLAVVRSSAEKLGGHMQEIDGASITVRVPAGRFDELVDAVQRLGELTERQIKASDITEEMRDLGIRMANAEQVRQRLLNLLEKAQKMEDTLKIEAELERVTREIELAKGKMRFLESQAAYSTLRVMLNSPLPQQQFVAAVPFQWVRELGDGLVSGLSAPSPRDEGWFSRSPCFTLPKGYIRYFEQETRIEAMSGDGMLIKVRRHDNYEGGDLNFWSTLARRALVGNRTVAISGEKDLKLASGPTARLYTGSKEVSGKPHGYVLALVTTKDHVWSFEAWGPIEQFEKDKDALEKAIASLRAR